MKKVFKIILISGVLMRSVCFSFF